MNGFDASLSILACIVLFYKAISLLIFCKVNKLFLLSAILEVIPPKLQNYFFVARPVLALIVFKLN